MVVSRRPLNTEARVPFPASPLDVVDKVALEQVSLRVLRFPPVTIIIYHRGYFMLASERVVKQHTKKN